MKVLMSAFAFSPIRGSEPGVGWNWAKEMSKYNEVWVLTRKSNRREIEDNIVERTNIKFIYVSIPFLRFIEKYTHKKIIHLYYKLWQMYSFNVIKKINNKESFDIVHHVTYNEFRNCGYLWRLDIPFIFGPIGGSQEIEDELLDYCEGNINKISEKIRHYINIWCKNSKGFKEAIKISKKIIIANTDTAKFLDLPNEKYEVILETGINSSNLNTVKKSYNEKIRILWVGKLIYRKGLRLLIEAFIKVKDKEKYEIIIVGDGDLEKKYINIVKENNLQDYFVFKGAISYEDTLKEYRNADIFIFTSLRDTSGNVVLEAMSNSLPIISLNHHGASDILNNECAIKIDICSKNQVIDDLSKAIELLGNNSELREIKGKEGYKRIKEKYLWEEKGKKMQEIYNDVLKK